MSDSSVSAAKQALWNSPLRGEYDSLDQQRIKAASTGDTVKANQLADQEGDLLRQVTDAATEARKSKEYLALFNQNTKQAAGTAAALNHSMGEGNGDHVFDTAGTKAKSGSGNPYAQQLSQTAQGYDALVKAKDDLIARDDTEIKTNETLISLYGVQPQYIKGITTAFADKISTLNAVVSTTKQYIATLTNQISTDQKDLTNSKLTSKQKQQLNAVLLKSENDLVVAHGSLVEAEAKVKEAQADRASVLENLYIKQDLYKLGITDLTTQLKQMSDSQVPNLL